MEGKAVERDPSKGGKARGERSEPRRVPLCKKRLNERQTVRLTRIHSDRPSPRASTKKQP